MSELSEKARDAAKSKAERLVRSDPTQRVDASGYRPDDAMDSDVQTGPRPVSRRQFRRGGTVAGQAGPARADRKPRAAGGSLTANSLINRDVKSANEEREGIKHVGGMNQGGRARVHKLIGGALTPAQRMGMTSRPMAGPMVRPMRAEGGKVHADEVQDKKLIAQEMHKHGCECAKCSGGRVAKKSGGAINDGTRPTGGRLARKGGGRTKKGTNVNIIITQPGGASRPPMPMPPPGAARPPGMAAPPPVGMAQGVPPGPPPAAAMPPQPMPRASGGRTLEKDGGKLAKPCAYPIDSGAGGGLGRLEKAERAARA